MVALIIMPSIAGVESQVNQFTHPANILLSAQRRQLLTNTAPAPTIATMR